MSDACSGADGTLVKKRTDERSAADTDVDEPQTEAYARAPSPSHLALALVPSLLPSSPTPPLELPRWSPRLYSTPTCRRRRTLGSTWTGERVARRLRRRFRRRARRRAPRRPSRRGPRRTKTDLPRRRPRRRRRSCQLCVPPRMRVAAPAAHRRCPRRCRPRRRLPLLRGSTRRRPAARRGRRRPSSSELVFGGAVWRPCVPPSDS